MKLPVILVLGLITISTAFAIQSETALAQEFRIETELFVGNQNEPSSENLTLFKNGAIYDFLPVADPKTIVIFDMTHKRFYLLDIEQKIKTTLDQAQLVDFTTRMKSNEALRSKAPFLFDPQFTEDFDRTTEKLVLTSERLTYEAEGQRPNNPGMLSAYKAFADWYAQINATNPHNYPPFARLQLNQATDKYGFIPAKVKLTIRPDKGLFQKSIVYETRHSIYGQLTQSDQKRIDTAQSHLTTFRDVTLRKFHGMDQLANN